MKPAAVLLCMALVGVELYAQKTQTESIDLPAVMRLAGAQAPDIALAEARLEEARANEAGSLWQFFPTLTPGIGYRAHDGRLQDIAGTLLNVEKQSLNAGAAMGLHLEIGEAIYRRLAAQQQVRAAAEQLAAQRQQTLLHAVQTYFDLSRAEQTVRLHEESLKIAREFSTQISRGVQAGLAFKGDELRATAQITRLELRLSQAKERRRHEGTRLAQLLALRPTIELLPVDDRPLPLQFTKRDLTLDEHVQSALAKRPELAGLAALTSAAQHADDGASYAPLYPILDAQYFAGGQGGSMSSSRAGFANSAVTSVSLGWKIGAGGLFDTSRQNLARARLTQSQLNEKKMSDEVVRQVVDAYTSVQLLTQQVSLAAEGIRTGEQGVKLALGRKEWAVGVVLEALQTQQDLIQAKLDYADSVADFNKAQFQLKTAAAQ